MENEEKGNEINNNISDRIDKLIGWARIVAVAGFLVGGFVTKQEIQMRGLKEDLVQVQKIEKEDIQKVQEAQKEMTKILSDFNDWRIALDNTRFYKTDGEKLTKAQTDLEKRVQRLEDVIIFNEEKDDEIMIEIRNIQKEISKSLMELLNKKN